MSELGTALKTMTDTVRDVGEALGESNAHRIASDRTLDENTAELRALRIAVDDLTGAHEADTASRTRWFKWTTSRADRFFKWAGKNWIQILFALLAGGAVTIGGVTISREPAPAVEAQEEATGVPAIAPEEAEP